MRIRFTNATEVIISEDFAFIHKKLPKQVLSRRFVKRYFQNKDKAEWLTLFSHHHTQYI